MTRPRLHLIAAIATHRVIGRDGHLPWRLPSDLKRFKRLTSGAPIIMGRTTYTSIGRPLPKRRNIVLSRSGFSAQGVEVFDGLDAAIDACAGADVVWIIGGSSVYAAALPIADELHLSIVDAEVEGDTWFPAFDVEGWTVAESEDVPADARHAFAHRYERMVRAAVSALPSRL
ncbi:MAG: dihydrofolate reductase [Bradymonadia bacterium]|jgi:dihydrofolate reductase